MDVRGDPRLFGTTLPFLTRLNYAQTDSLIRTCSWLTWISRCHLEMCEIRVQESDYFSNSIRRLFDTQAQWLDEASHFLSRPRHHASERADFDFVRARRLAKRIASTSSTCSLLSIQPLGYRQGDTSHQRTEPVINASTRHQPCFHAKFY
jgi:hypothetical protein